MRFSRTNVAVALALLVSGAAACNSVLGIDSATLVAGDGGGGAPSSGACQTYCTTIQTNCTGANQEYLDLGTCTAICQNLEPGTPGDTTQDSLSCRTHFANLAASDPVSNCRSAGPLGGSNCGNAPCTAFCELTEAFCGPGSGINPPPYDNAVDCVSACQGAYPYLLDAGDIALSAGNTLNCRTYHLESAYEPANPTAKTTHCPHTAAVSAVCFDAPVADAGPPSSDAGDAGD